MLDMQSINATEVRKNWSSTCDSVARFRPSLIKRTHDSLYLSSRENMLNLLSSAKFECVVYKEDDGSYTISSVPMDLVENAVSKEAACAAMAESILDYAEEYYENYTLYSNAPNRASHLPYITKALLLGDANHIKGELICRNGKI